MNPEQYAIRARVALCQKWPELERYDQTHMLDVLAVSFRNTEKIVTDQDEDRPCGPKDIPPTVTAVATFLQGLGSDIIPEEFMDFYGSKGWKVGDSRMKDWHCAARRAHRTWGPTSRGFRENIAAAKPLTEWERKTKMERLKALEAELKDLRFPGGSAYPVFLAGAKAKEAAVLIEKIGALKEELE